MVSKGKDVYWKLNSLASLACGLTGRYVIVDLRNDSSVNGKIEDVDGFINLRMSDVVFTDPVGHDFYFHTMFVKFRHIRDVQIPNDIQVNQTILRALNDLKNPRSDVTKSGAARMKQSRLMQRQLETLQRVEEIKKERLQKKKEKEEAQASTSAFQPMAD